ncbi:MAG TPA: hypothetical protein PLM89_11165, partial [Anaerolineales bacterium]|nr:hypothetical protein [Anaerolineales bacterium]
AKARAAAQEAGRYLEVVALVAGTDEDPQNMDEQIRLLKEAGAIVEVSNDVAARRVGRLTQALTRRGVNPTAATNPPVALQTLNQPLAAINVGLESFFEALTAQGAEVVHVDWKPAAGGNEKMMDILARMKSKK